MATVRIFLTGKMHGDSEIQWRISPPPEPVQAPQDGELARLIREGEDTADYQDYLADIEFWRTGEW